MINSQVNAFDFSQFSGLRAQARGNESQALEKIAPKFESMMLQQMLKNMRSASLGDDALGGEQTAFYQEMFDQQISEQLAASKGFGVADMLIRQLKVGPELTDTAAESAAKAATRPLTATSASAGIKLATTAASPMLAEQAPELPSDWRPKTPTEFAEAALPAARNAARMLGIQPEVLVAQAALQSGWGRQQPRQSGGDTSFNVFNVKAGSDWDGDVVSQRSSRLFGPHGTGRTAYRAYDSLESAFNDYAQSIKNDPRYADALQHGGDGQKFIAGLQAAGYATDSNYADKVMRIAEGSTVQAARSAIGRTDVATGVAQPDAVFVQRRIAAVAQGAQAETVASAGKAAGEAVVASAVPDNWRPRSAAEFVSTVMPHARQAAEKIGVPAEVLVAQAALETGWGRHQLRHPDGSASFNFFGIKADKRWQGSDVSSRTTEFSQGRMHRTQASFRSYDSIADAFDDYVNFLQSNPRYADALRHGGDARQFTSGLQKAGYATDPRYSDKIMRIAHGRTMNTALAKTGAARALTV
ncbi:flagellar assembly peptidoglycan hydrolase FlgJ [Sinimarinibacterium sp. CAU 1509]|uniref:flagellar assembly peptidoglycan hydrolase FlgJ n=1 Tax=Sinimarinibacterium sp. CAU 1509 TaxID=2562283 RepID=UPI0010AD0985|nr:flagellar assembly peptidoglycan hydrolase FlgJ [Sinimarinibacterium sp. CAU 1509]TJY62871.1 flagellar assembly peptidoglycan hydrolase FlgJ [Sinimarinibacterium sp. CAU 1509]